jgi:DHA3 family macrolide efflux protein-like MFS transporter
METTRKINVFNNKNFVLLFFGVLFSNVAHILFNFAMSLYVLRVSIEAFGRSQAPLVQAIYLAVGGFLLLILTPFGGSLADKKNKVKIMVATDLIRGLIILVSGIIMFMLNEATTIVLLLFAVTVLLNINSAFFTPASGSLLRFILKDDEMQQGASLLMGSQSLQNIIGLILGGILYVSLGIQWIFIINGIGYIISAISEIFIRYDSSSHQKNQGTGFKSMLVDIKTGLQYLVSVKGIFSIVIMALMINFFFSPLFSNGMPYFIEYGLKSENSYLLDHRFTPEHWLSVMNVTFSISAIVSSLYLASKKPRKTYGKHLKKVITMMSVVVVFSCITTILYYLKVMPINLYLIVSLVLFLGIGFSMVSFNVPVGILLQTKVDKSQLGKVNSLMSVLSQALIPVSSLIAGVVISQLGIVYLYVYCGIGIILVNIWYVRNKNADTL